MCFKSVVQKKKKKCGPVVKTPIFQCTVHGFDPHCRGHGSETEVQKVKYILTFFLRLKKKNFKNVFSLSQIKKKVAGFWDVRFRGGECRSLL